MHKSNPDPMHSDYDPRVEEILESILRAPEQFKIVPLTEDEVKAIHFWRGRCCWADACFEQLQEQEDGSSALVFESEAATWFWRDECDLDAEGGHSLFPGVSDGFREKLWKIYQEIV